MAEPLPIACSLDAESYATRLAAIRAVGERSLLGFKPHDDGVGIDLYFFDEGDIHRGLREVIQAEAKCCAFLEMNVEVEDGKLRLSISGPADAEPVVRDLVQSFTSGRESGAAS